VPGGALEDPLDAKKEPTEQPPLFKGPLDVFGAGWFKPATPGKERRDGLLI